MNYSIIKLMTYRSVHQMSKEGFSIRKIAADLNLDWRAAKALLNIPEQTFLEKQASKPERKKSLQEYELFVKEKLVKFPETPAAQMHDWLKECYADFPVVTPKTVFNYVMLTRAKFNIPKTEQIRDYFCVPELEYGLQAQVDFGFYTMSTLQPGKTKKVQFFTFVLSRSRYKFILFSDTPFTTITVIGAHELAFATIGGTTTFIVYDQDRVLMVSENLGDLILTAGFQAYINESRFSTHFCRKADPESKGKVENVVKYVKQNFLRNRVFKDLETLNQEATAWLARTANALEHGTTKKIPAQEFEIQKEFLAPWQPVVLETAAYAVYTVHKDNKISYKSNVYSLPIGTYKGKNSKVLLKVEANQLILMNLAQEEICHHEICMLKGQKILASDHRRDKSEATLKMMTSFSESMPNPLLAMNWMNKLKDAKPRYFRDQVYLLKKTVTDLDPQLASAALNYAIEHQITSANDFKAIVDGLRRKQTGDLLQPTKIIQMNPLDGEISRLANICPERSEISTYDALFINS